AGLVARGHLDRSAQLSANLPANPFDQLEQAFPIPGRQAVLARLVAQWGLHTHHPTGLLNSIAIKQPARASLRAVDVVSTKRASIGLFYARLVVVCIHRTGTTTLAAPA